MLSASDNNTSPSTVLDLFAAARSSITAAYVNTCPNKRNSYAAFAIKCFEYALSLDTPINASQRLQAVVELCRIYNVYTSEFEIPKKHLWKAYLTAKKTGDQLVFDIWDLQISLYNKLGQVVPAKRIMEQALHEAQVYDILI